MLFCLPGRSRGVIPQPGVALGLGLGLVLGAALAFPATALAADLVPPGYFEEPANLPFNEEILARGQEPGFAWTQFKYTSIENYGEPTRVHAVYAVPEGLKPGQKVPALLVTHGIFGAVRGNDKRYWDAVSSYARAGYAVFFFDWYPNFAQNFKPERPDQLRPFTTFGKLNYFTKSGYHLTDRDLKDSLHYQVSMAAKRALTWMTRQPEVDSGRIGATGASYGGIFSSMIAGQDARIAAVNPMVFTAGFGKEETGYNSLPKTFSAEQEAAWKARFDAEVLLQKRDIPKLYTIGANDSVFSAVKGMRFYELMKAPKQLLLGPNEGHGYWAMEQSVAFFDAALKGTRTLPLVEELVVEAPRAGGREVLLGARSDARHKVDFFVAPTAELDVDLGPSGVPVHLWRWARVPAEGTVGGVFTARYTLPEIAPYLPGERIYRWGKENHITAASAGQETEAKPARGALQVFARVKDASGAITTTPLARPLPYEDAPRPAVLLAPTAQTFPAFLAAARVTSHGSYVLDATVPTGQPVVTLDLPLQRRQLGTQGYVLWNWNQKPPSATLKTGEVATPTKRLAPGWTDTIADTAFTGGKKTEQVTPGGGMVSFVVNGVSGQRADKTAWHGSVPLGQLGREEVVLEAPGGEARMATVVLGAPRRGAAYVRVSLGNDAGNRETVVFYQEPGADHVLQFQFKGRVKLGVALTSYVAQHPNADFTHVGPTALFLD